MTLDTRFSITIIFYYNAKEKPNTWITSTRDCVDSGIENCCISSVISNDFSPPGTRLVGYNRLRFLIECLADLDEQFKQHGGPGLLIFRGKPATIFKKMREDLGITKICYEQDCEPIWRSRDKEVELMCRQLGIETVERVSHTLWDPKDIIRANGGYAPLTYQMMLHTVNVLGLPKRPVIDADFVDVEFGRIPSESGLDLYQLKEIPQPEDFGVYRENSNSVAYLQWNGGEKRALEQLKLRMKVEHEAFAVGMYLPNQVHVDLLAPPTSMSAALRFGCLSPRRFYYAIHDKFNEVQATMIHKPPGGHHITGQLIWREYFYTMSVDNPNYAQMKDNPICLDIPWGEPSAEHVERWKQGKTGIPIIDASMRQLLVKILPESWGEETY